MIWFRATRDDEEAATAVKTVLTGLEKDLRVTVSTMGDVRWKLIESIRTFRLRRQVRPRQA